MKKLGLTQDTGRPDPKTNRVREDPVISLLKNKLKKLFKENHTVKGLK